MCNTWKTRYLQLMVCGTALMLFFLFTSVVSADNNHSLYFDGINDYVTAPDTPGLSITGDFTVEFWVKFQEYDDVYGMLVSKYGGPDNFQRAYNISYYRENGVGYTKTWISDNGLNTTVIPLQYQLDLDSWYHLTYVYRASEGRVSFYVAKEGDEEHEFIGVMDGHVTSIHDSVSRFMLGTSDGNDPNVFHKGWMDEVKVWNVAREKAEIDADLFAMPTESVAGLVGYWNFEGAFNEYLGRANFTRYGGINLSTEVPDFTVVPESKYQLYTQVVSSWPSLASTTEWSDDVMPCGTIAACGCAITSLTMVGRYAGVSEDLLGDDVNPGNMNTFLKASEVNGYQPGGGINWLPGVAYMSQLSGAGLSSQLSLPTFTPLYALTTTVMAEIDVALAAGNKAVLAYKKDPGHFLWVTEKTADGYLVNDPRWFNTKTASDTASAADEVKYYGNEFDSARIFTIYNEPQLLDAHNIEATVIGSAQLLFKNTAGDKTGYEDGNLVYEVEGASYGELATISATGEASQQLEGAHLLVPNSDSSFTIQVIGTGTTTGEFTFEVMVLNASGTIETHEFTGRTLPGIASTFEFDLETGVVTELPIDLEQFEKILDILLGDATEQQREFFYKRAEKLFDDMEEKTVTQALQSASVFRELLKAKRLDTLLFFNYIDTLTERLQEQE